MTVKDKTKCEHNDDVVFIAFTSILYRRTKCKQTVVVSNAVRARVFDKFKIPKVNAENRLTNERPTVRTNECVWTNKQNAYIWKCIHECLRLCDKLLTLHCLCAQTMNVVRWILHALLIYIFHISVNVNTPCTHSDFFMHALVASHRKAHFPKYEIEIEIYEKKTHTHSLVRSPCDRHNKNDNHLVDARQDKKIINIWVWALINMSAARTANDLHKHQILLVRTWCCGLNVMCLAAAPAGLSSKNRNTLGAAICQKWEDRVVCHSGRQYPMGTAPPTSTGVWLSLSIIRQLVRASRILNRFKNVALLFTASARIHDALNISAFCVNVRNCRRTLDIGCAMNRLEFNYTARLNWILVRLRMSWESRNDFLLANTLLTGPVSSWGSVKRTAVSRAESNSKSKLYFRVEVQSPIAHVCCNSH